MTQNPINTQTWFWLFFSLLVAYVFGLFVPLMNEDASHHANLALHMVQNHDYVSLVDDRGKNYLDKPHLHFWLSALSFNIFGINTIAYKIPSFLLTILGLFSTYRLAKLLYNHNAGLLAALMYACAQAQFLANNDVRMDAILTASIVFATWQLVEAATCSRWYNYVLAALGLAMAFTTKGMIGFVMPCVALFFLLLYQRNWKTMFNWRWILVVLMWAVFISPCVYAYYLQYDLHPEIEVRGMRNISGVKFILWSQNFERLDGSKWGKGHKDIFFFFHTLLWAFLPFCLLTYIAFFDRMTFFIKNRFQYFKKAEFLTTGTIIIIFAIISSSGYQLPHYLNILFPFFAIITAGQVMLKVETNRQKTLNQYLWVQYFVIAVVVFLLILLNFWCFPVEYWAAGAVAVVMTAALAYVLIAEKNTLTKLVAASALTAALTNVLLNGNVYQQLLNKYQAGIGLARVVNQEHIPAQSIFKYQHHSSGFDFYAQRLAPDISVEEIKARRAKGEPVWIYASTESKQSLAQSGFQFGTVYQHTDYGITRLTKDFLNPNTRPQKLTTDYLIQIK
ncbi:glycosyltransferase family 39 protein [Mucilaginibacter sp. Bleaf8]|uniref:ArnT family glycosyltransferase n=1 Tax=Mucilaginibacter sp. Bleaf8 TaxID=2834430 RepID=UPI001BCADE9C|nr:glycosyltransferase family 39 protein [Mucilaginibacter sp. Bleaf8]MBS7565818.1 glycosyltransferase family 39 protein [Mucilaginibacter sp. Bleaf8]